MAIKQFITLEGAEQVVANLKKISDAGEQALNTFRRSGEAFVPVDQFTQSLRGTSQAATEAGASFGSLTEAGHLLRPVLEEIGVHVGNIRELSFLAREGIAGLATALVGALAVAAAKAADAMDNLNRSMGFLFGGQGTAAVAGLSKGVEGLPAAPLPVVLSADAAARPATASSRASRTSNTSCAQLR
jgi:hypothetical protein